MMHFLKDEKSIMSQMCLKVMPPLIRDYSEPQVNVWRNILTIYQHVKEDAFWPDSKLNVFGWSRLKLNNQGGFFSELFASYLFVNI